MISPDQEPRMKDDPKTMSTFDSVTKWPLRRTALALAMLAAAGAHAQTTDAGTTGTAVTAGVTATVSTTTTGTTDTATTPGTTSTATTSSDSAAPAVAPVLSSGQLHVATRVAAPFATLVGSSDNATALATALRTGTEATLTTTSTDASGATVVTTTTIVPPTKPMGWGNVSHALALARFALADAGVTQPTNAELQAALVGGNVTAADGSTVTLAGVLQQRADGMGWGQIARTYGTTMGAVNRGVRADTATAATSTTVTTADGVTQTSRALKHAQTSGATSNAGAKHGAPRGLTTAAGTPAATHGKGLTTASGAASASGKGVVTAAGGGGSVVSAASGNGGGHAYGRGIVTASGGSANAASGALHGRAVSSGVVTAAGAGGNAVTAKGADANTNNGHGKGKGG
jgi:hypothetical protein